MATGTIPSALRKGDTIAFVSPSRRLNNELPDFLSRSKAHLERLGYKVKIIFDELHATTFRQQVLQRCEELHSAFRDPTVKAILCTSGGSHANELLPHLDYDLIRANPKIFCGYSDITVLNYALLTQAGLRTFYGPCAITEFGDYPQPIPFTTDHFVQVLQDSAGKVLGPLPRSSEWTTTLFTFAMSQPRHLSPSPPWKWLREGKATGRIIGGCIASVPHLAGTKFWADTRGKILLLETAMGASLEDPYPLSEVRQRMANLVNMGVFEEISGLVIGRSYKYDEKMTEEFGKIVLDQCYGTSFPILANVDVGHTDPILTIPINALASLDSGNDEFSILEAAVLTD